MREIDARGLACPAPVLKVKAIIQEEKPEQMQIILDNSAAQQNVQRLLESQGFTTSRHQQGEDYWITASGSMQPSEMKDFSSQITPPERKKIMVMCGTDRMGFGDDTLGMKLMVNFLRTLKEMGPDLWRLVFVNNGVKLTIDGSEVLDDLKTMETEGLKVLVCGTCLNHFNLLERKQVGETTNMLDIVTAMQLADKTINI
jgi:selenium metabolism protein YedF